MFVRIANLDMYVQIAGLISKTLKIFIANRLNVATIHIRASGRNGVPTL